jgi:hypothetical protein
MGAAASIGLASAAIASSGSAWEEFRQETRVACTKALKAMDGRVGPADFTVRVSDYGSESFGTAVINLKRKNAPLYVCIFKKTAKGTPKAEIATIP